MIPEKIKFHPDFVQFNYEKDHLHNSHRDSHHGVKWLAPQTDRFIYFRTKKPFL